MAGTFASGPMVIPRVTINMSDGPLTSRRAHDQAMWYANYSAAEWNWKFWIPFKFKLGATEQWGYYRRSTFWMKQKEALGLGNVAFVATGTTEREVAQTRPDITATKSGSSMKLKASLPGLSGRFKLKAGQFSLSQQQEQQLRRKTELEAMNESQVRGSLDVTCKEYLKAAERMAGRLVRIR